MKYKFKPSHVVPAYLFVVAVLYGGSKPPCPTNTPPDDVPSPTNLVGESKSRVEVEQWNLSTCSAGQPEQEGDILCSPSPSTFTLKLTRNQQSRWNLIKVTRRGFFSTEPTVTLKPRKPGLYIIVK